MFNNIYNRIANFFKGSRIEDEEIWINKKLNEWKLEMYANNKYLNNIPIERIKQKKIELTRQYKNLK
jgi:hypothetical protein